jgi:hypothetical protein
MWVSFLKCEAEKYGSSMLRPVRGYERIAYKIPTGKLVL